jgi:hypothetical protein
LAAQRVACPSQVSTTRSRDATSQNALATRTVTMGFSVMASSVARVALAFRDHGLAATTSATNRKGDAFHANYRNPRVRRTRIATMVAIAMGPKSAATVFVSLPIRRAQMGRATKRKTNVSRRGRVPVGRSLGRSFLDFILALRLVAISRRFLATVSRQPTHSWQVCW